MEPNHTWPVPRLLASTVLAFGLLIPTSSLGADVPDAGAYAVELPVPTPEDITSLLARPPIAAGGFIATRPLVVTPELSERLIGARILPSVDVATAFSAQAPANAGPSLALETTSLPLVTESDTIAALARALRHDPDLIYQFVRDNVGV
jgi:hypothetical protein